MTYSTSPILWFGAADAFYVYVLARPDCFSGNIAEKGSGVDAKRVSMENASQYDNHTIFREKPKYHTQSELYSIRILKISEEMMI